jgi:hypothetical protein
MPAVDAPTTGSDLDGAPVSPRHSPGLFCSGRYSSLFRARSGRLCIAPPSLNAVMRMGHQGACPGPRLFGCRRTRGFESTSTKMVTPPPGALPRLQCK